MRRVAVLALVVAATAVAPAAAATHPDVARLWHEFPLGRTRIAHTPRPPVARHHLRPSPAPRPHNHHSGTPSAALAGTATALTVIGVVAYGRRRGWAERRAGTAPRVLAFYAVAAAVGVIVGLLIPLVS
ncbi:MAG: hypothetical protein ACTHMS_08710 [Jatrophihabitans sp.]|uniref:hypothetical protein n=1 Tax=Jatrophihabitans sp. TaxID=1932789 RepID=UPI003F8042A0